MRPVVFLGPSLSPARARRILDARYLPPVQRGDVLRELARRPSAIAIVDGYFDSVRSVWHKEIMVALERGVPVFGAASMGALRAAELAPFGMVGVGQVFQWYRDGEIEADDEVAVIHGPEESGFRRMSDAMVDIRDVCAAAVEVGAVTASFAAQVVAAAKDTYYPERSMRRLLRQVAAVDENGSAALERFHADFGPGVKERDARALLMRLAIRSSEADHSAVSVHVERTVFLERLEHEVDLLLAAGIDHPPTSQEAVSRAGEPLAVLRKKALLRVLARREAQRLGLDVDDDEMQDAADAFRRGVGLLTAADTVAWAAREGVSDETFVTLTRDSVLMEKLETIYGHQIAKELPGQVGMSTARHRTGE